jgi:hypothetical protein
MEPPDVGSDKVHEGVRCHEEIRRTSYCLESISHNMSIGVASLVLFAALLHASWNAMLRSGRDRFWTASVMALAGGSRPHRLPIAARPHVSAG